MKVEISILCVGSMDCEESLFSSFIASFMQFCPLERKMVKLTMIARIVDGLPLAEGLDDGRDIPDADFYKQQVKSLFKNLATGHNEPSRMSIETGPYMFQYPFYSSIKIITLKYCVLIRCHLLRELKGHFATATFLFSVEMADYCRVLSTQVFI